MTFCPLCVVFGVRWRGQGDVVALMGGDKAPCTAEVLRFEVEDAAGKLVYGVAVCGLSATFQSIFEPADFLRKDRGEKLKIKFDPNSGICVGRRCVAAMNTLQNTGAVSLLDRTVSC